MSNNVAESPGRYGGSRPVVVVVGAGSKHWRVQQEEEFVANPNAEQESSSETANTNNSEAATGFKMPK